MFKEFTFGDHLQRQTDRGFYCDCEYGSIHHDAWEEGKGLCWHLKLVLISMRPKNRIHQTTTNCNLCNKKTIYLMTRMIDNHFFQLCNSCINKINNKELNNEVLF